MTIRIEERDPRRLIHNIDNPRGEIVEDDKLRELAASIKEKGVLQPIRITPDNVIRFGHRRTVAAIIAGLSKVPVIVDDGTDSRAEQIEIMLIENAQREDLTILQTARAYEALHDCDIAIATIAKAIGSNKQTVATYLDVLKLPTELHAYFETRELPLGAVVPLLRLKPGDQLRMGRSAAEGHWTVRELTRTVENSLDPSKPPSEKHLERQFHINAILAGLERVDRMLDAHFHLREVQSLIRQATRKLIAAKDRPPASPTPPTPRSNPTPVNESEPDPFNDDSTSRFAGVTSFGMRQPKPSGWKSTRRKTACCAKRRIWPKP